MKGILKGFDPDLGRKYAEDHGGLVVARGKQLAPKPEEPEEEMPPGLDAQQQHDWELNQWLKRNRSGK